MLIKCELIFFLLIYSALTVGTKCRASVVGYDANG